ncbi:protease adaptor protein RcdA [Rhodoblastus sp.]|uniref:protease adaptor protein RcdA n=1 Tax=Rhodoblastus sp. TaxID=1962975 RepID=UPI003F9630DE
MGRTSIDGGEAVSFAERLATSDAFKSMFREGMALVEEAAAYLDGAGREEARALPRNDSLAYAAESMRLTTRLMQLASWLLLQRAVNEGELTLEQAANEKRKVKLSYQEAAAAPEVFARLPKALRDLVVDSLRLQARILHLDQLLYLDPNAPLATPTVSPVEEQLNRLRAAFS